MEQDQPLIPKEFIRLMLTGDPDAHPIAGAGTRKVIPMKPEIPALEYDRTLEFGGEL